MRIVFFGTPAFAVPSLQALLAAGHQVAAVVTQPDRPQGRSRSSLVPPPVKLAAQSAAIEVLQPDRPVGDEFEAALQSLGADLGVVVAYGHILRSHVLALPRLGMVNVHASLLPRWRGAAPVQWAIAAGDDTTGVSIMKMTKGLDSGPVWLQRSIPVSDATTGGALTDSLAGLGATALVAALPAIERGDAPLEQDATLVTLAPKLDRAAARIDWNRDARSIVRHINAFDPVPGAWTSIDGHEAKLYAAALASGTSSQAPGSILPAGDELRIVTGKGVVSVREVLPSGKRRQSVADWLHGHELPHAALAH